MASLSPAAFWLTDEESHLPQWDLSINCSVEWSAEACPNMGLSWPAAQDYIPTTRGATRQEFKRGPARGQSDYRKREGGKRKHADSSVRHYRLKSIYQKKMFSVIADVGTSRAFYFFLILYVKDGVWKAKPLQKWLKTAVFLMASRWRLLLTPLDSSCLKVVL